LIQSIKTLEPEEKAQLPKREPQRTLAQQQILAGKRANALRYANKLRGLHPEEIVAPPRLEDTKEETHVPAATAAATADV
jgi:hypothetical protein